jgi:hypothetical protein
MVKLMIYSFDFLKLESFFNLYSHQEICWWDGMGWDGIAGKASLRPFKKYLYL